MLALLGYCVVVVDSRGSDYRGQVFESYLNRKMGTVEINDQVVGLEHAAATFKCIGKTFSLFNNLEFYKVKIYLKRFKSRSYIWLVVWWIHGIDGFVSEA